MLIDKDDVSVGIGHGDRPRPGFRLDCRPLGVNTPLDKVALDVADVGERLDVVGCGIPPGVEGQDVALEHSLEQSDHRAVVAEHDPALLGISAEHFEAERLVEGAGSREIDHRQAHRERSEVQRDSLLACHTHTIAPAAGAWSSCIYEMPLASGIRDLRQAPFSQIREAFPCHDAPLNPRLIGGSRFRWHLGPMNDEAAAEQEPDAYFCPLCGVPAGTDQWWTKEQLEYAQARAIPEVLAQMSNETGLRFEPTSDVPAAMTEPNDMDIVQPPCHPHEPIKVPTDHEQPIHCLVCGSTFAV